jgi:hypothetical protein
MVRAVQKKLHDVIGTPEETAYRLAVSRFLCRDKEVETFLCSKAFDFDCRNVARTYLLIDQDSVSKTEPDILAYYSLSVRQLVFDAGLSKNKIKEIDGFSKIATSVSAILIGQLGKNILHGDAISGTKIMSLAMTSVRQAFDIIGCRIAFLECQQVNNLISFYLENGFEPLRINHNGLLQMIRFL